jgi:hypothetical protein
VVFMVCPSELHVVRPALLHSLASGTQVLQRPPAWLQHFALHDFCSANAEPSALQVRNIDPSGLQVTAPGMQTISVHCPASSLQSTAESQLVFTMNCPSSAHWSSLVPSQ